MLITATARMVLTGLIMIILLMIPSIIGQDTVPGFELLDNFSEELSAGDNLVTAETTFSLQLSVCLWINPSWIRRSK